MPNPLQETKNKNLPNIQNKMLRRLLRREYLGDEPAKTQSNNNIKTQEGFTVAAPTTNTGCEVV